MFKIIPSNVFFSKELTSNEKLMYSLIASMLEDGYCNASNRTISEKMGLSIKTISRSINNMVKIGFLHVVYNDNSQQMVERKIYIK